MLLSSYKRHKNMHFAYLYNGVSPFCPMKSSTAILSQKELKNDNTSYAWLLLSQGHVFLHWIWAHQVVLNQLAGPLMWLVYSIWIHNSKNGSHHAWCMIAIFNFHTSTRCLRNWTVCASAEPPFCFKLTTILSLPNRPKNSCEVTN